MHIPGQDAKPFMNLDIDREYAILCPQVSIWLDLEQFVNTIH